MFRVNSLTTKLRGKVVVCFQFRNKSKKEHWSVLRRKTTASKKALEHFDDFYKKVFGTLWPSIRVALLSPRKYCAVVNNFGDADTTISHFENQGAFNMKTLLELERQHLCSVTTEKSEEQPGTVSRLAEKIERLSLSAQQQEEEELYPPTDVEDFQAQETVKSTSIAESSAVSAEEGLSKFSLAANMRRAQIDETRMIYPDVNLSAGSLLEFVPAVKLKGLEDRVLESEHYKYYQRNFEFPVDIKQEFDINFPEKLNVFTYERGNVTPFESPRRGKTGVLNYYLMDGSSVLPVLALGVNPGDRVLDMCAAPGGKSLLILQTLYSDCLVCNDILESRTNRIHSVLRQYIYDLPKWKDQIVVTTCDGRDIEDENKYDKILVDVPCTTDRHSLHEDDNNIFNSARIKERLRLPEIQCNLLKNALKLVVPGGSVVYSTCTLSPIQNDGVVHMALQKIWEETKIEVEVRDLSPALDVLKMMFRIEDVGLKYGHLVLPFLPLNFGPLYFCKLVRTK